MPRRGKLQARPKTPPSLSPSFHRGLPDWIDEGIAVLDSKGRILYSNRALSRLLGAPSLEHCGQPFVSFLGAADRPSFKALLSAGEETEIPREMTLVPSPGSWIPILLSLRHVTTAGRRNVAVLVHDLSVIKGAEEVGFSTEISRICFFQAGDAMLVFDGQGLIQRANLKALQMCGRNPLLLPLAEALPLELRPASSAFPRGQSFSLDELVREMLRGNSYHGLQAFLRKPEGIVQSLLVGVRPLAGAAAKGTFLLTLTDITRYAEADEAQRHLATLVSSSEDGILGTTGDGKITAWNAAAERLFGYPAREALGRPFVEFVAPDARPAVTDLFARILHGERVGPHESYCVKKGDSRVAISMSVSRIPGGPEQALGLSVIVRDITERKRMERRQAAQFQVARVLGESSTMTEAVPALLRALGESLRFKLGVLWYVDPVGQVLRCVDLWRHPKLAVPEFEAFSRAASFGRGGSLAGHVWASGRSVWLGQDETERTAQAVAAAREGLRGGVGFPVRIQDRILGVVELFSDVPKRPDAGLMETLESIGTQIGQFLERTRAERELRLLNGTLEERVSRRTQELQNALREIEEFATTLAHDLRAPLRSMSGFSQALLADAAALAPHTRLNAERIVEASRRMDALIRDLLAYSQLNRGDLPIAPVDLRYVVASALQSLAPMVEGGGAEIEVVEPLYRVLGNEVTLLQTLTNLISNAVTFVAPGTRPRVRIRAERRPGTVRLWVEDNGIGIAPEHHERIFGIFERLNRREDYPGTGIGLAIVRRGLERLAGRVGLESRPGEGSRFWIELPEGVEPAERGRGSARAPAKRGQRGIRPRV